MAARVEAKMITLFLLLSFSKSVRKFSIIPSDRLADSCITQFCLKQVNAPLVVSLSQTREKYNLCPRAYFANSEKYKVSAVALDLSAVTTQDVNTIKLSVYSDPECTKQVGSDISADKIAAGEVKMTVPSENAAAGLYYVVTVDCKQSSANKNGFVQISKVSYLAAE